MSKLTTALKGEKEKLSEKYVTNFRDWRFEEDRRLPDFEIIDWSLKWWREELTASNLRILSILEEWVKENKRTKNHETDSTERLNGINWYNQALSDLTSFIQEAISNTTK